MTAHTTTLSQVSPITSSQGLKASGSGLHWACFIRSTMPSPQWITLVYVSFGLRVLVCHTPWGLLAPLWLAHDEAPARRRLRRSVRDCFSHFGTTVGMTMSNNWTASDSEVGVVTLVTVGVVTVVCTVDAHSSATRRWKASHALRSCFSGWLKAQQCWG